MATGSKLDIHTEQLFTKALPGAVMGALFGVLLLLAAAGITAPVRLEYVSPENNPIPGIPFAFYSLIGITIIGGTVGYLYQQYRTLTPPLVAVVLYVSALANTWWTIQQWSGPNRIRERPPSLNQVTSLETWLLAWPLVLISLLGLAAVERYIRH